MTRRRRIAIFIFTVCTAFAAGWYIEHRRNQNRPTGASERSVSTSTQSAFDCDNAPGVGWRTVRLVNYQPGKTAYRVVWEFCAADIERRRVRVMEDSFRKALYEYEDDQIVRIENVTLLGDRVPQLLIMTGSSGTNDRVSWHILGEVNGQLHEWTSPNYEAPAEKLLQADEDFCCKEWNFHLRGRDIVLARGIYHKDEDGNCCPSRGGVLVWLKPIHDGLELTSVQRISRPEYYRWRSEPFCSQCTLPAP